MSAAQRTKRAGDTGARVSVDRSQQGTKVMTHRDSGTGQRDSMTMTLPTNHCVVRIIHGHLLSAWNANPAPVRARQSPNRGAVGVW
ncbi:hypothetical protein [Nocardia sp. NPDC050710]|uniref:hypothetical protein n=1 Tax=Nocardia sp. NPDC050710 TaxID=3157220 RepID=UPI0033BFEF4E